MARKACWIVAVLIAATATATAAQEMTPEQMKAYEEISKPGEEHARLEPMVGSWEQTVRMYMAPGTEPMVSSSTSEAEWTLDGRWIEETYTGSMMGQPFHGRNLIGYDKFNDQYVAVWFDNMSTAPMISTGTWSDATNSLEMSGTFDDPMTEQADVAFRTVTHWKDGDTLVYEMYMPGPDGAEFKAMEVEARRAGAAGGE